MLLIILSDSLISTFVLISAFFLLTFLKYLYLPIHLSVCLPICLSLYLFSHEGRAILGQRRS